MFDPPCQKIHCVTGPTAYSIGIVYKDGKTRSSDSHQRLFGSPTKEQKIEHHRQCVKGNRKKDKFNTEWSHQIEKKIAGSEFKREVSRELNEYQNQLRERKQKLHKLLEDEENSLIAELESKIEIEKEEDVCTSINEFKEQREERRQQLIQAKLDMQFAENSEELRSKFSAQIAESVLHDRREQIREQECLRRMKKLEDEYYDCLWNTDYLNKLRKEEQEALERHARSMEMVTVLNYQVKNKTGGKEERQRVLEEERKIMTEQRCQLELEKQREKEEKFRKKQQLKEMIVTNICQVQSRKDKERLANEECNAFYANLTQDAPSDDIKTKHERLKEAHQFLEQVAIEKKERQEREKESERLILEDAERLWQNEMAIRSEDREWREKLMRNVIEERRLQMQLNIEENARKQKEFMDEVNSFHKLTEFNKQLAKEDEEKRKMSIEKYRKDISKQIEDQKEQEKCRRELMNAEYETYKNQEEEYKNKLTQISGDPSLGHVHQMRLKSAETSVGETDTMLNMMMRIKSLQDVVDQQKKNCLPSTSTSKRQTCQTFNNILAYHNNED